MVTLVPTGRLVSEKFPSPSHHSKEVSIRAQLLSHPGDLNREAQTHRKSDFLNSKHPESDVFPLRLGVDRGEVIPLFLLCW